MKRRHNRIRKKPESDIPQHARRARKCNSSDDKKSRKYGPVKIYIEEELDTPHTEDEE